MSDQLSMFEQMTSEATGSVTGSLESASGATLFGSPDGPMTAPSGPDRAPAPPSAPPAKVKGLMTLVTSGRYGCPSSGSADLQLSLESRLMERLDTAGSTLFQLTWRRPRTPLGRRYLERAASAPRTGDSGFTSWPTVTVNDARNGRNATANRSNPESKHHDGQTLCDAVTLAGWPTPAAQNWKHESGEWATSQERMALHAPPLNRMAQMAGWPTPKTPSGGPNTKSTEKHTDGIDLDGAAMLAGWPTPRTTDTNGVRTFDLRSGRRGLTSVGPQLNDMAALASNPDGPLRLTATGQMQIGSSAGIGNGGQLDPAHSRWLMALPPEWCDCAVMAMASVRKQRRRS